MKKSKHTQHTFWSKEQKQKFKYSEFKYQIRQRLVRFKERIDTDKNREIAAYLLDVLWNAVLWSIIALAFNISSPIWKGIGMAIIIPILLDHFKDVVRIIKK